MGQPLWNSLTISQKVKHRDYMTQQFYSFRYILRCVYPHKYLHMNVHNSIIHNSQKVPTTETSTN